MKNFKQFTTSLNALSISSVVFMMVQRWRISSNSQPHESGEPGLYGCLWWFKDEEFQAIHNNNLLPILASAVFMMVQRWRISSNSQQGLKVGTGRGGVYDGSKMKNFKQFTTRVMLRKRGFWCLWWFKDEEFQAIHNRHGRTSTGWCGVYDGSKMKNFKQFTTGAARHPRPPWVFMMVQRWRISSNSQPASRCRRRASGCLWWFKDEEFQAIHNRR